MKTIEDVFKEYLGKFSDVEVYRNANDKFFCGFHGAFLELIDDSEYSLKDFVFTESLMDEEMYNYTMLTKTDEKADFKKWFGDKNAKILVVVLSSNKS